MLTAAAGSAAAVCWPVVTEPIRTAPAAATARYRLGLRTADGGRRRERRERVRRCDVGRGLINHFFRRPPTGVADGVGRGAALPAVEHGPTAGITPAVRGGPRPPPRGGAAPPGPA